MDKVRLPVFDGKSAPEDLQTFIAKCDALLNTFPAAERETKTASAAILSLEGVAARWVRNLKRGTDEDRESLNTWTNLRAALIARFGDRLSLANQSALLDALVQGPEEPVLDFADRVRDSVYDLEQDVTAADRAKEGFQLAQTRHTMQLFLRGLRPSIKSQVESDIAVKTFDGAIQKACAVETADRKEKREKKNIAEVNTKVPEATAMEEKNVENELQQIKKEIAEMTSAFRGMGRFRGRGGNRGGNRGRSNNFRGGQYRGGGGGAYRGFSRGGNGSGSGRGIFCFRCRRYGNHIARYCDASVEEIIRANEEEEGPFDYLN